MARKHEKFSYSYGWRTAPEQWCFFWNGKSIRLDNDTNSQVACLMLEGRMLEAEAILKKLLRKQEKEDNFICIGFLGEDDDQYYFTQSLKCRWDDMNGKLYAYKKWKRYIIEHDYCVPTATVTSGYLRWDGKMEKERVEESSCRIDISRPCIIRLKNRKENNIFWM